MIVHPPHHIQSNAKAKETFALDVLTGLCARPKHLEPKYFYDDKGSEIFQKITQSEAYYPTRCEFSILRAMKDKFADYVDSEVIDVIELGAGDGHKSILIIEGLLNAGKTVHYYPIDISPMAMTLMKEFVDEKPNLHVHPVVAEYFEGLSYVMDNSKNRKLVLFLGSNIGNFNRVGCQRFLGHLWAGLNADDYTLIGFDLKKEISMLVNAYNDPEGLTAEFNLNLLSRINRELSGNFDTENFIHYGLYNPILGAMESYLVSKKKHKVYIGALERSFLFKEFEPIHIEYSFKFLPSDIENLCDHTGYVHVKNFSDENNFFTNSLWKVRKGH